MINCVPETVIASVEIVIVFLIGLVLIVVVQRQQMIAMENSVPNYVREMENALAIVASAIKTNLDYLLENFVKSFQMKLNLAQF